jgi:hypothetical protein
MKQQQAAQLQVIDRVLYLLEEQSIQRLAEEDKKFGSYIRGLYGNLSKTADKIEQSTKQIA